MLIATSATSVLEVAGAAVGLISAGVAFARWSWRRREVVPEKDVLHTLHDAVRDAASDDLGPAQERLAIGWLPDRSQTHAYLAKLAKLANRWPTDCRGNSDAWATERADLTMASNDLTADRESELARTVLYGVPTRRVVILGPPGAGKSFLLNLIVEHWPEHDSDGSLTPRAVILSLASWKPSETLTDWLTRALITKYPFLEARDEHRVTAAADLVRRRQIFPILDGFDEIAPNHRKDALKQISDVSDGVGYVISCREDAWSSKDWDSTVALRPAPPSQDDIRDFLIRDRRDSRESERWRAVLTALGTRGKNAALAELRTPLMLDFARVVYGRRPGREPHLETPISLCDHAKAGTLSDHLMSEFIPALYRPHDPDTGSIDAPTARKWFGFLASHLRERARKDGLKADEMIQDFNWSELRSAAPTTLGILAGMISGIAVGLAAGFGTKSGVGFGVDLGVGILTSLAAGELLLHVRGRPAAAAEPEATETSGEAVAARQAFGGSLGKARAAILAAPMGPMAGLAGGLVGGTLGGLASGIAANLTLGHSVGIVDPVAAGVGIGLASGPALGLWAGMAGAFLGGLPAGPLVGHWTGLPAGILNGVATAIAVSLIITRAPLPVPRSRPTWHPVGVAGGIAAALAVGVTAWAPSGRSISAIWIYCLVVALVAGGASGLVGHAVDRTEINEPLQSLRKDRGASLLIMSAAAAATGLTALLLIGFNAEYELHYTKLKSSEVLGAGLLSGVAVAIVCGLVLASVQTPWLGFVVARAQLAGEGKLPLRLMRFLADAGGHHDRGVMRENGPSYRFRHLVLQQHLEDWHRVTYGPGPYVQPSAGSPEPAPADAPCDGVSGHGKNDPADGTGECMLPDQDSGRNDKPAEGKRRPSRRFVRKSETVEADDQGGGDVLARKIVKTGIVAVDVPDEAGTEAGDVGGTRRISRIDDKYDVAENEGE
jgi:NACHT domain